MTNENEQPEARVEGPAEAIQPTAVPAASPETAAPVPPAAAAAPTPVPVAGPSRWPSSRIVKAGAAVAVGVLLFGSGVAVGSVVDGDDHHRPRIAREGMRGLPEGPLPRDRQIPRDRQEPERAPRQAPQDAPGRGPQR